MGISKNQASLLFLAHYGYVRRVALRHVPVCASGDDIVQQVFIEFTEKADQWEIGDDARPLLAGITQKIALGYWRDHARHNQPDVLMKIAEHLRELGRNDPSPQEHDHEIRLLRLCLEKVPKNQRKIIDLYYFEKMSTREIVSLIGKNMTSIQRALSRIRAKLRDCINQKLVREEYDGRPSP